MSIPRQFHFLFGLKPQTSPFHVAHYLCLRSCLEVNRPEAVNFHYQNQPWGPLWDLISPELTLRPLPQSLPFGDYQYPDKSASAAYRYAHASDFLRVAILQREGGVYADIDTLFIRRYPDHLFSFPFVMGQERVDTNAAAAVAGGSLCNAVILSEAGSNFSRLWQERMTSSFDGSWSRHSTFLPYELSRDQPDAIHVEPETSFFYLDWTAEGIHRLLVGSEDLPDAVYSLHLWAHLWWDAERNDVSRFSADELTPEYVAYANTTYARYARTCLPAAIALGSKVAWRRQYAAWRLRAASAELASSLKRAARAALGKAP